MKLIKSGRSWPSIAIKQLIKKCFLWDLILVISTLTHGSFALVDPVLHPHIWCCHPLCSPSSCTHLLQCHCAQQHHAAAEHGFIFNWSPLFLYPLIMGPTDPPLGFLLSHLVLWVPPWAVLIGSFGVHLQQWYWFHESVSGASAVSSWHGAHLVCAFGGNSLWTLACSIGGASSVHLFHL